MTRSTLHHIVFTALWASIIFWILFQLSKVPTIQNVAPFADDPYDTVASFGFQIALAVALLSLARWVSIHDEQSFRQRVPFILHGTWLVFVCFAVTLATCTIAIVKSRPLTGSVPMNYIAAGLIILTTLSIGLGIQLVRAQMRFGDISPTPTENALALAIADCWTLVTVISAWLVRFLPFLEPVWKWVDSLAHRIASGWNKRVPFANPAIHPWGFAFAFAMMFGLAIMAVILFSERIKEGSPPTPAIGLLLAGIFFAGESIAIFISFLLFGGFLGLRPKLNWKF